MRLSSAITFASLLAVTACGSSDEPSAARQANPPDTTAPTVPAPEPETEPVHSSNSTAPSHTDSATDGPAEPGHEPAVMGEDGEPAFPAVPPAPMRRRRNADPPARLQLVLRSSPPGAIAAIDGKPVGPTPAYWNGDATGRSLEFTFVLEGYAMARYRFVPLRDGVVHATLEPVIDDATARR